MLLPQLEFEILFSYKDTSEVEDLTIFDIWTHTEIPSKCQQNVSPSRAYLNE